MSSLQIADLMPTTQRRSAPSLSELLEAVACGERRALVEVYEMVETSVRAFALSRLGDADAAADVLQDVMLAVWRQASTFRGGSRPRTWILGIAHHKITDRLRHKGRWRMETPDPQASDPAAPTPLESAQGEERRDTVRRALRELSEPHQAIIHLAFYEDLAYSEIATLLEIAEGTVKTRVFHAKKILARRLERLGVKP